LDQVFSAGNVDRQHVLTRILKPTEIADRCEIGVAAIAVRSCWPSVPSRTRRSSRPSRSLWTRASGHAGGTPRAPTAVGPRRPRLVPGKQVFIRAAVVLCSVYDAECAAALFETAGDHTAGSGDAC